MHDWSDKSVDWTGINDAAQFIRDYLVRWGRVNVRDYKEKFGTVRVYCDLGWYSFLGVTHPGYCHYGPYPKWLAWLDIYYGSLLGRCTNWAVVPYHKWLYRRAYRAAIRRWPHLAREILAGCDWSDLLRREFESIHWGLLDEDYDASSR